MQSCPAQPVLVDPTRLTNHSVLSLLAQIPDPRYRRGIRYPIALLIGITLAAILSAATNLRAIGQWAQTIQPPLATLLGLGARRPDESTIRRVLARLDNSILNRLIGSWTRLRSGQLSGRTVISFDGKTVRGAKAGGHHAPHLVAGLLHGDDTVIAQAQVDSKSNEIPCLKQILKYLAIAGCLIIADAMHTQYATAIQILAQQGHYLFTVKANQPTMMRLCADLPWNNCPRRIFKDGSHGRRVTRTITVLSPPAGYLGFPGVNQIARLTRTRNTKRHQDQRNRLSDLLSTGPPGHAQSRSLTGSNTIGPSRTGCITYVTPPSVKMLPPAGQVTCLMLWLACVI